MLRLWAAEMHQDVHWTPKYKGDILSVLDLVPTSSTVNLTCITAF